MFGLDQALGRKPKEEAPIVMAASDKPVDIDHEGIIVPGRPATRWSLPRNRDPIHFPAGGDEEAK